MGKQLAEPVGGEEDFHIVAFCVDNLEQSGEVSEFEVNSVRLSHELGLGDLASECQGLVQVDVDEFSRLGLCSSLGFASRDLGLLLIHVWLGSTLLPLLLDLYFSLLLAQVDSELLSFTLAVVVSSSECLFNSLFSSFLL